MISVHYYDMIFTNHHPIPIVPVVTHPDHHSYLSSSYTSRSIRQAYANSFLYSHLQEVLDGLEFAKGDASTTWGSVRAALGHPEPFDLRYVAIGNEECPIQGYRGMHLVIF